jgi:N-acetylglucosaminyldiphosphoundecaprenol N-acetyl-beta-D-mannosaminyltransferase
MSTNGSLQRAAERSPFDVSLVAGVPFAVTTLAAAAEETVQRALSNRTLPRPATIRLSNAYCVAVASQNPDYHELLTSHGVNLPDGAPVAWMLRRSAEDAEQVRGPSYFVETIRAGLDRGLRHFFFGSSPETLDLLEEKLAKVFPGVQIAGTLAPPFGSTEQILSPYNIERIRSCSPDIVWVGLGSPKQDFVSSRLAEHLNAPCAGVGAAFDFVAGTVKEAPTMIQKSGFEWLYRLAREPRRLWRRYLFGNLQFIAATVRHR